MDHCQQCGRIDNPIVDPYTLAATHFVRPEIQYLREGQEITLREKKMGWIQRIFQGRQAIERWICIDCLNANYIQRQLKAEYTRKAKALEADQSAEGNFYLLLTDADGNY